MSTPRLTIGLDKIEHNSRTLVELCSEHGIAVTGVTKATCGNPEVAKAMLRGGVCSIADSRLENIHRLKAAAVDTVDGTVADIAAALAGYTDLFTNLLWTGLGVAAIVLLLSPLLKKWMHGVH